MDKKGFVRSTVVEWIFPVFVCGVFAYVLISFLQLFPTRFEWENPTLELCTKKLSYGFERVGTCYQNFPKETCEYDIRYFSLGDLSGVCFKYLK